MYWCIDVQMDAHLRFLTLLLFVNTAVWHYLSHIDSSDTLKPKLDKTHRNMTADGDVQQEPNTAAIGSKLWFNNIEVWYLQS